MAENNEDQPIDEIPLATSIAGAKILGIASNGDTNLFSINDIKGDYKGLAIASTNPGTPALAQVYDAQPGVTYTNFKDANNAAITIPTEVGGNPILTAKLIFNGTSWQGVYNGTPVNVNLDLYAEKQEIKELNTDYTKFEIPLEYGIRINEIINIDGTVVSSGYWDSILIKTDPSQKYKINNISGLPLTRVALFASKPLGNAISYFGDGSTPITGDIPITESTNYVALNFSKSNPTDQSFYKGSSLITIIESPDEPVVEEEDFLDLPVKLNDKVTLNRVVGSDGNQSGFTGDWDYVKIPVIAGKKYDVVGLKNINIISFFNSDAISPSSLVSGSVFNGTQRSRSFVAPLGAAYAVLSLNKTGTPTDLSTYDKAYAFPDGIYKYTLSQHGNNIIMFWGNSVFQGNYAEDAQGIQIHFAPKVPNYNVINAGVGGETSLQILGRQGGVPFYLKNAVTIPASASTRVLIGNRTNGTTGIYSTEGYLYDNKPLTQAITTPARDTSLINPVLIEGVECLLTWDESTENQYLQRVISASQPYTTKAKAIIHTRAMRDFRDAWANIFLLFTNDNLTPPSDFDVDAMLRQLEKGIEYSGTSRYIVMSEWSDQRLTLLQMVSLEDEMQKRYGARLFNTRRFAIERAPELLGVTPSAGDQARMDQGLIPLFLTIDGLHFTNAMNALLAEQFYQILVATGVIKSY